MATIKIETDVDVYCAKCGKILVSDARWSSDIDVEPCVYCLQDERNEGRSEGIEEASNATS